MVKINGLFETTTSEGHLRRQVLDLVPATLVKVGGKLYFIRFAMRARVRHIGVERTLGSLTVMDE